MKASVDDVGIIKRGRTKLSPTQLTLRHYRNLGYVCDIAEYYNAYSQTRHDLFNFVDVVAVNNKELLLIQTTTKSNTSARRKKINSLPATPLLLQIPGIRILVVGWHKVKHKWEHTIHEIT